MAVKELRFDSPELGFDDVAIVPMENFQIGSPAGAYLYWSPKERKKQNRRHDNFTAIPVISSPEVTTLSTAEVLSGNGFLSALPKDITEDELMKVEGQDNCFLTVGITDADIERVIEWSWKFTKIFVQNEVSTSAEFETVVKRIREVTGDTHFIMAGNVARPKHAIRLIDAGADCVNVGIPPNLLEESGMARGQVSIIQEVHEAFELADCPGFICSGFGCKNTGDIAKAMAVGADFVMLGSMFAGHKENGGEKLVQIEESGTWKDEGNGGAIPSLRRRYYYRFRGELVRAQGTIQETVDKIVSGLSRAVLYSAAESIISLKAKSSVVRLK